MADPAGILEEVRKKAKSLLKEPGYALLEADLATKERFREFKKSKPDLETLLAVAVCVLEYAGPGGRPQRMLCCSNVRFVNLFKARKKGERIRALKSAWTGMRTNIPGAVRTYDLVDGRPKTVKIPPNTWYVVDAWMFSDETLPALAPLVRACARA